jgi:hypothetical protein
VFPLGTTEFLDTSTTNQTSTDFEFGHSVDNTLLERTRLETSSTFTSNIHGFSTINVVGVKEGSNLQSFPDSTYNSSDALLDGVHTSAEFANNVNEACRLNSSGNVFSAVTEHDYFKPPFVDQRDENSTGLNFPQSTNAIPDQIDNGSAGFNCPNFADTTLTVNTLIGASSLPNVNVVPSLQNALFGFNNIFTTIPRDEFGPVLQSNINSRPVLNNSVTMTMFIHFDLSSQSFLNHNRQHSRASLVLTPCRL